MSDKAESFNYFNNPFLNYKNQIKNFDSVQNMDAAEFAALATLYMYDSKSTTAPLKPTSSFNGKIDESEFKDTKEQYEKKIAEIKALAPKYGKDLSKINIPTYEEFQNMPFWGEVGIDTLCGLFSKKKSLDDEIGLKGQKYTSKTIDEDEFRTYQDGTEVEIKYNYMTKKYGSIVIRNTDGTTVEKIYDSYTQTIIGIMERGINQNGICIEYKGPIKQTSFYPNGKIESVIYKGTLPYQKIEYDKNGKQIKITYSKEKETNKKIINELVEATKGFFTNKTKLQNITEQITNDNAWEIYNEFRNITGKNILDCIKDDDTRFALRDKLSHGYKQGAEISDFKEFSQILTFNILDELKNYKEYDLTMRDIIIDYESATGRDSLEYDIANSNLSDEEKNELLKPFKREAMELQFQFRDGENKNDQIKNEYYKGDIYDIEYNDNIITIHNKRTGKNSILNIDKLCSSMSTLDKAKMHITLQGLPAEVMEDMVVEMDSIESSNNNKNMYIVPDNETWKAGGYYAPGSDTIVTNILDSNVTTHELGHAIDCLSNNEYQSTAKSKFITAYNKYMERYKNAGYTQYSYKKGYQAKEDTCNYCTANEKEMFAECYTLLMLGNCQSKDVILKYFSECLKETAVLLKEIRNLPDEQRHNKK